MGGHIIIRQDLQNALQAPLVWAGLPLSTQQVLTPIFDLDPSTWSPQQCETVGKAAHWAICNL